MSANSITTLRAVIYARVSTTDQNNTLQIRELTEYVEHRGWELAGIYEDRISGSKASRPGLDRLMADARLRKFESVVVYKLDRWGRSLVHCIAGIQELQALGIRFVATSQGLDTDESNPASKLLMHILAAVAQFERELIRERVSAGMRGAKRNGTRSGKAIGRPRVIVDRQRVVLLRNAGASWAMIGKIMSVPPTTARRAYDVSEASRSAAGTQNL